MKKKNIFLTILCVLCIISSCVVTSFYPNVSSATPSKMPESLEQYLTAFILAKKLEQDPKYEYITFEKGTPDNIQQDIKKSLNVAISTAKNLFENDGNFHYECDIQNKITLKNFDVNIKKKDTRYYETLDSNTLNATDDIVNLINANSEKYYEYCSGTYYCGGEPFPGYTLHMPSDVVLTFYIPTVLNYDNSSLIDLLELDGDQYAYFFVTAFLICSAIIALYIFLNKYVYEKEAYIFRHVNNWLFEPAFFLFLVVDALLASGTCILTTYSIEGTFLNILNRYHIEFGQPIVYFTNILAWSITLFFIGLSVYWLKCQFTTSIRDWFFHRTLVGKFILYFSNKVERIISTDLSDKILKKYIIFSTCLILILAFISLLNIPFFSFFIVVTALIGISVVGYKKIKNIQGQYQDILHMTEDLSSGNFENIKPADSGLFQSLNNNIYQIKDGFEQAVKEQVQSQNLKTELISNVSHDLKTPLTGIKNYVELLNDPNISEKDKKSYLERLNQYTDRLSILITDLFEVSKANSGNIDLEYSNINIIEFIEQVCAENEELLQTKNLQLVTHLPEKDVIVSLDGNKTYRIFENLFTNISKYALENTRVFLDVKDIGNSVVITMKNTSKAPLDFNNDITERFVRGDKSRHEAGSGLGLAIVKSFTEVQNGTFMIETDGDLFKSILSFRKSQEM
ncbi:MFS domain-containing histidine kinase [uncultured Holdemanella sp.]|uniref:MFS domain-containing histidine kinase n=1 Tax=uncultured Holdemanella sp. TaxID=1763549 RepID=UPI0025FE897B|nr:MFS domain-containing histidine kinase [uncultured Holdemanella sp.]